jgi:hypothetical protein
VKDQHGEAWQRDSRINADPDTKLADKGTGKEAKLLYCAHALIERRKGLLVAFQVDEADGRAERRNAIEMLDERVPGTGRITVGGDTPEQPLRPPGALALPIRSSTVDRRPSPSTINPITA